MKTLPLLNWKYILQCRPHVHVHNQVIKTVSVVIASWVSSKEERSHWWAPSSAHTLITKRWHCSTVEREKETALMSLAQMICYCVWTEASTPTHLDLQAHHVHNVDKHKRCTRVMLPRLCGLRDLYFMLCTTKFNPGEIVPLCIGSFISWLNGHEVCVSPRYRSPLQINP